MRRLHSVAAEKGARSAEPLSALIILHEFNDQITQTPWNFL